MFAELRPNLQDNAVKVILLSIQAIFKYSKKKYNVIRLLTAVLYFDGSIGATLIHTPKL